MPDLDELRSLSHQLRPPSLEALADTARRRDRRAAVVIAAGATSMVAAAMAVVLVVSGPGRDRPRLDPAPAPAPSVSVSSRPRDEATGFSRTSQPTTSAGGKCSRRSRTRSRPRRCHGAALRRAGSGPVGVPGELLLLGRPEHVVRPDRRQWWRIGDSVTATRRSRSRCLPCRQTSHRSCHSGTKSATVEVRMFVTGPIPQQHLDCFDQLSPTDCQKVRPLLEPLGEHRRELFGVSLFEQWAPPVGRRWPGRVSGHSPRPAASTTSCAEWRRGQATRG